MASAEEFGRKLLDKVEVVGLNEVLRSLRLQGESFNNEVFGLSPLDRLLQTVVQAKHQTSRTNTQPPIIELMSLTSGGGKTHMLYYLIAKSILPLSLSGKQACVVVIDTDDSFSISRLVCHLRLHIHQDPATSDPAEDIETMIAEALKHVHIFHPQTLASTTATLNSLAGYLFNSTRHFSFDRQLAFIAIDSAATFYWRDRAETEDAAFLASTASGPIKPVSPQSGYVALASALKTVCRTFDCPAIVTNWYLGSSSAQQQIHQYQQRSEQARAFRSSLPPAFAGLPTLRLVVKRVPVRKFPIGISFAEAKREAEDRQKVVDEGRFECFLNEWGLDERLLRSLKEKGGRFGFSISEQGVLVDDQM